MASLDNARVQDQTYLKKQTAHDNDRFRMMAKKLENVRNLASGFDMLIGSGERDYYAVALLAAFHAPSNGDDSTSSPSYEPPEGLSPVATWRAGPKGDSTILELASQLVSDPADVELQRAFKVGLHDQLFVIKRLYEASGDAGFTDLKRFVIEEPQAVRDRLLGVYNILMHAVAIVDEAAASRASGFRQPNLDGQTAVETVQEEAPTDGATNGITKQFVVDLVNNSLTDRLLEIITPLAEGFDKDREKVLSEMREVSSRSKLVEDKLRETQTASTDISNEFMLRKVTELEGKLAETQAAKAGDSRVFEDEVSRLRDANSKLAAEIKDVEAKVQPNVNTPISDVTEFMLRKLTELEGKTNANPADKGVDEHKYAAELERLQRENAKLVAEAKAASVVSLTTPVHPRASGEHATLSGRVGTPGRETTTSDCPAPRPAWTFIPKPIGLEGANPPNYEVAWSGRPAEGDVGKTARKQLGLALQNEKLLDPLPPAGDTTAYGVIRGRLFENFYLFSEYINCGGVGGEVALLRALTGCAGARHKTDAKTEPYWRTLMGAPSVLEFLKQLDGIYADRNRTASELEWEEARKYAIDALDYFERLRHLLVSDDARRRGRTQLVTYLAQRGEKYTMSELQKCSLDELDEWHTVLDSLRSVAKQMAAAGSPAGGADRRPTAGRVTTNDSKLAALTKTRADDCEHETLYEGGYFRAEADTTMEESSQMMKFLMELRKDQKEQKEEIRKLAAFNRAPGNGGVTNRFRADPLRFGSEPPLVWDLQAIKEFTDAQQPVPERRGPHNNGTHGEECFACAALGYKFDEHDTLASKGFPVGWRAYHNAWTCKKIPKFVEMKAQEKGASREEVEKVLTKIEDPTWKPRGV